MEVVDLLPFMSFVGWDRLRELRRVSGSAALVASAPVVAALERSLESFDLLSSSALPITTQSPITALTYSSIHPELGGLSPPVAPASCTVSTITDTKMTSAILPGTSLLLLLRLSEVIVFDDCDVSLADMLTDLTFSFFVVFFLFFAGSTGGAVIVTASGIERSVVGVELRSSIILLDIVKSNTFSHALALRNISVPISNIRFWPEHSQPNVNTAHRRMDT